MCQQYATRILLCAVLLLPLIGWSYSQSKTDELRSALSKVLDELENVFEKEIAAK